MIRSWAEAINLKGQYGAHTLRKSFGYHQRVYHGAGFEILCKRYNHSNPAVTMRYLGIIQRILGHTNRKTTEGYLQSIGEAERKAMENLGNLKLYSADQPAVLNKPINQHKEYWQRKAERPEYDVLCEDIEQLGYVGTGRKYGVSDNAIRKWKRSYENEIKKPKSLTQILTQ